MQGIAGIDEQGAGILLADRLDCCRDFGQTDGVAAVILGQDASMHIVGMQDRDVSRGNHGGLLLGERWRAADTEQQGEQDTA